MSKVIIHATMSLDGFIAGPHDEMDWMFKYGPTDQTVVNEVLENTGAVVAGSRSLNIEKNQLPYGGMVKVPVYVLTQNPQAPITKDGMTFTFVTDGLESAITQAKSAAGDKNISILGASVDQQCLRAGIADEIQLHVVPILLGEGIRIFDKLGSGHIELERIQATTTTKLTDLRFRILK